MGFAPFSYQLADWLRFGDFCQFEVRGRDGTSAEFEAATRWSERYWRRTFSSRCRCSTKISREYPGGQLDPQGCNPTLTVSRLGFYQN
jgi:hypothetical protein